MTTVNGSRDVVLDMDDVDFAFDELPDLAERCAALRETKPAAWVRFLGEPAVLLTSWELVNAAFREEDDALPGEEFYRVQQQPVLGKTIQSIAGEEHRLHRALAGPFFRQRLMPGYVEPVFERTAHELIDRFADRGEADLVEAFTTLYPLEIIIRLLDLPPSPDLDFADIAWKIIRYAFDLPAANDAIDRFDRYITPVIEGRRREPGDDLISALVTEEAEGHQLTNDDVFSFVRLLFPAGAETTVLGLGNTLLSLLTHPEVMERTLADLEGECPWVIEEGMRWQAPVAALPRRTRVDVEWRGLSLPAETNVALSVVGANRDPAAFNDPDVFDPRRRPQNALTFGIGRHYCIGVHLARAEMAVALRVLLERLPGLRLDERHPVPRPVGGILRGLPQLPVRFG